MFVNIIQFPSIKKGKDKEFREWFDRSNRVYARFDGFISRRLLEPTEEGKYVGLVEHESEETFMEMHLSPERKKAWDEVRPLLDGSPAPAFYEVIMEIRK